MTILSTDRRLLQLYRTMLTARRIDLVEQDLLRRGEAFFMVSGAGHEATAALAAHLRDEDWLHCHYRDKALMLARGMPPVMFFQSLLCRATSHSAGRQMSAHLCDPERNILSLTGPVGNNALQAVGVAAAVKDRPGRPVVLCSMGDGTTQEGEVLEAIGEAVRWRLPVLFLVQDNEFAISTVTEGKTFYSLPDGGQADSFYSLPITYVDGRDVVEADSAFRTAVERIRRDRQPQLMVFKVKRLWSHTNADDQRVYRSADEISEAERSSDPLHFAAALLEEQGISSEQLRDMEDEIAREVEAAAETALDDPEPDPEFDAKAPIPVELSGADEYRGSADDEDRLTMIEAMREVLRHHLTSDPRVTLYGEDIEDPKGDVFGVTKSLTSEAPDRVRNSPLAEATIVGAAIGRALAGERPVAFLQFADFFPIAYNQIISEMGSMHWRTAGGYQCPVIVMITCGGYRPGLGPFHAHTMDSVAAHTPGVDVFMPSTAADAAGMLNAAFKSGRPTLFFYPKNCLNDRTRTTSASDLARQIVPVGKARIVRSGSDITLVGWGNAVELCEGTAEALETVGVQAEVIDLRSLSPWDKDAVTRSVEKTQRLVVVHEDNLTSGFGAEVLATVLERVSTPVKARRVTRPDTYVPCNFGNQLEVLPSFKRTLEAASELLGLDLSWEKEIPGDAERFVLEALGSSPSDESLVVLEWMTREGEPVKAGQFLAEVEADKATFELNSPVSGVVEKLLVGPGERIKVGAPMAYIRVTEGKGRRKPATKEESGTPRLSRREAAAAAAEQALPKTAIAAAPASAVGLGRIAVRLGSRTVPNEEIIASLPGVTAKSVVSQTGISSRQWAAEGETALTLAVEAAREVLESEGLSVGDLDMLVCSTGTPVAITPSMACLILNELAASGDPALVQAYDINAACSGYLYALQATFDALRGRPDARALVVTTEVLSPMLDREDKDTAIIFGDAATATLVHGDPQGQGVSARLHRPVCSASGESGESLSVPMPSPGCFISMKGTKVFSEAVRSMARILEEACLQSGMKPDDLDLVVPHQANQRILDAIRRRMKIDPDAIYSNIRNLGNTSSNTIPICLKEIFGDAENNARRLGLCAFGGGFTFAAAVVERV